MTVRKGIARYAFENLVRQMAIDVQPLSRRLWDAFDDAIVREEILRDLSPEMRSELDRFSVEFIGCNFEELDTGAILASASRLNDASSLRAFDRLMEIKDALDTGVGR